MSPRLRRVLPAVVFVVLAAVGLAARQPPKKMPRAARAQVALAVPKPRTTWESAVRDAAEARKRAEISADAEPGSWSRRAGAARAELGYAQLTGDYAAYAAADASLAKAFAAARRGIDDDAVGPRLLSAQLGFELHRLRPALEDLRAPERQAAFFHDEALLADIASLRGAILFQLGKYDEGLALLRSAVTRAAPAAKSGYEQRLAVALAKVGHDDEAVAIFERARDTTESPRALAWIETQLSQLALERGRRAEGRRHLENALSLFPGWFHAEEHLAELDAEEGATERAKASYTSLVARTADPEFMDALAALTPEPSLRQELEARSARLYEERLAMLPEASYGHALEHYLMKAPDPARALELAKRNAALRPNGEARTRLAQALLLEGRTAEARAEIDAVVASAWVSTETYATAALVHELAGDRARAAALDAKARARDPEAASRVAWLRAGASARS